MFTNYATTMSGPDEIHARRADAHQRARILREARTRQHYPDQSTTWLTDRCRYGAAAYRQETIGNGTADVED